MKPKILIVDDEPRLARAMQLALSPIDAECTAVHSAAAALEHFDAAGATCVVTDWRMPGMDGLELLNALHERQPDLPVVVVTAHGDVASAVAAMKRGAFDYVLKPFDNDELRTIVRRATDLVHLKDENAWLRRRIADDDPADGVIAESDAMRAVVDLLRRVAPSTATVLIEGESGTGKEVVAKLVHHFSDRVGRPFVAVNCKAFAEGVLESELFGHERGAFTSADTERTGCFERADGGTLFLDEIGEISASFQGKLLRVLQEGEVLRVGGETPRRVDVRIVAATNRDLPKAVESGMFREDLYYRLAVIPVRLAPLAERPEDLDALTAYFLERHRATDGVRRTLSAEAVAALRAHRWPGNVRELESCIQRAVLLARTNTIEPADLLLGGDAPESPDGTDSLQAQIDRATRTAIEAALDASGGHKARAAAALGIDRTTLYRLMKRF